MEMKQRVGVMMKIMIQRRTLVKLVSKIHKFRQRRVLQRSSPSLDRSRSKRKKVSSVLIYIYL